MGLNRTDYAAIARGLRALTRLAVSFGLLAWLAYLIGSGLLHA